MCANSEGSGETVWMCRLARAFAGRLCDKYHNLMSWLKAFFTCPNSSGLFMVSNENILRGGDSSVSFLACSIPDLSFDCFTIYLYTPVRK